MLILTTLKNSDEVLDELRSLGCKYDSIDS